MFETANNFLNLKSTLKNACSFKNGILRDEVLQHIWSVQDNMITAPYNSSPNL